MPIPNEISLAHIEKAFDEILREGVPTSRGAVNTFIERKRILFPIKHPVALANKFANGYVIPTQDERGNPSFTTHEAIIFFEKINQKFSTNYKVWVFPKVSKK